MTALPAPASDPAHDRWLRVVEAVGARLTASGQAEMACPAHGGEKANSLVISVGDEAAYPLVFCRSEHCDYADVRAALIALGAPADALSPAPGAGAGRHASAAKPARALAAVTALPTEEQRWQWQRSLWENDESRDQLRDAFLVTDEVLAACEVGYDNGQRRVTLVVSDGDEVQQVIYRSLTGQVPKSKTHPGVRGSFLFAPFDLTDGVVLLCAGERDAFAAHAAGWNAVTFTGGEGSVPPEGGLVALTGRDVVVVYDADPAGRKGRAKAADALAGIATTVRVADLSLALAGDGKDVQDLLSRPDGAVLLREAVGAAAMWADDATPAEDLLVAVQAEFLVNLDAPEDYLGDLLNDDEVAALPPVPWIAEDWFPAGTYSVVYGEPNVGKTLLLLDLAWCVRRGIPWMGANTRQGAVLFFQGEGLEQMTARSAGWLDAHPAAPDVKVEPVGYSARIADVTQPHTDASLIRTVRSFEAREGTRVTLLVIDPLVEFMTGEENGDGMERASRGLRALAKLLDCAVVVGHHSNASGDRERGSLFLKMRAGTFVRMEPRDEGEPAVGVLQEKQRNGAKYSLTLQLRESANSVVFDVLEADTTHGYIAQREGGKARRKAEQQQAVGADRARQATAYIKQAAEMTPGASKTHLVGACMSRGVGKDALEQALARLVADGVLRTEDGPRRARLHYLVTP